MSKNAIEIHYKCSDLVRVVKYIKNSLICDQSHLSSSIRSKMGWDIGWSIKKCSIKVKEKCTKKWRWPCRKLKIWYMWNNIMVFLFAKKIFFFFWFIWLVWPYKCLILTILTMTKCLQNLLRDSTLSVISIAKKFLF